MTDALDRAAQAAYESRFQPDGHWLPWGALGESNRRVYRAEAAAALQVMADDLRELHRSAPQTQAVEPRCLGCALPWPCSTVHILDRFVGGTR